jgi:hypothetical protein
VLRRGDDENIFLGQVLPFEAIGLNHLAGHEGDVHRAVQHRSHLCPGIARRSQIQMHQRILDLILAQKIGKSVNQQGFGRTHVQRTRRFAVLAHGCLGFIGERQQAPRVLEGSLPDFGQRDFFRKAVEQRSPQFAL